MKAKRKCHLKRSNLFQQTTFRIYQVTMMIERDHLCLVHVHQAQTYLFQVSRGMELGITILGQVMIYTKVRRNSFTKKKEDQILNVKRINPMS